MRFDRNYRLTVGIGNKAVIVEPPLRVQFDALKSEYGGINKLNLKIYNLNESKRLKLVRDDESEGPYIPVKLEVGYGDDIEAVFIGNVQRSSNDRAGSDFVTSMECYDGMHDVRGSFTNKTVRSNAKALEAALVDMPNTKRGKINLKDKTTRPKVLVGNSYRLMRDLLQEGQTLFIDNEQVNILDKGQVISRFVPKVSARTGLLNTPERQQRIVSFSTMMNPSLKIRGLCELVSVNAPHLNGVYTIRSINYKGDLDGNDWLMLCEAELSGNYTV